MENYEWKIEIIYFIKLQFMSVPWKAIEANMN